MVKLDGVCEGLNGPLLTGSAHHSLNLILKEALERMKREDLVEASPAAQHVQSFRLNNKYSNMTYGDDVTKGIISYDSKGRVFCSLQKLMGTDLPLNKKRTSCKSNLLYSSKAERSEHKYSTMQPSTCKITCRT